MAAEGAGQIFFWLGFVVITATANSQPHSPMPMIAQDPIELLKLPKDYNTAFSDDKPVVEVFNVKSDIRYRFATTQLSSVMRNVAHSAQEVEFDVTLPKEAFIMAFQMVIDDKRYDGQVKERAAAKREYHEAVERGQSAGHVRQAYRHANIFQVSVNVAAGSAVNFTLTYQELLRRRMGLYEHEIYIALDNPVKDFLVEVNLQENRPLRFVRTPELRRDELLTNEVEESINKLAVIERPSPETSRVVYTPSVEEQGEKGITARFVLQYDVQQAGPGGDVLAVDGYFVHFLSPDYLDSILPKDIVFVLDISGSMHGTKIYQLKVAMETVLSDLKPTDRFNILTFSDSISRWRDDMVGADKKMVEDAKRHVRQKVADGGTNINAALLEGLKVLRGHNDRDRIAMIFFLTDGLPTVGLRNRDLIVQNIVSSNEGTVAIFSLAFGDGADFDALKQISAQNNGFSRKIFMASDASLQVASLYDEISAVAMKDLKVTYQRNSEDDYSATQTDFPVVFNGTEIVICGVIPRKETSLGYKITGTKLTGDIDISYEVRYDDANMVLEVDESLYHYNDSLFTGPRDFSGLLERMWAYLTIKQLLRQQHKFADDRDKVSDIKAKVLELSLKYKLVTPLTSMVVTRPNHGETNVKQAEAVPRQAAPRYRKTQMSLAQNPGLMHPRPGVRQSSSVRHSIQSLRTMRRPTKATAYSLNFVGGENDFDDSRPTRNMRNKKRSPNLPVSLMTFGFGENNLVAISSDDSICILPKRWTFRRLLLLAGSNNTRVVLSRCKGRRKCQGNSHTLILQHNNQKAFVTLGNTDRWRYSLSPAFNVKTTYESLQVVGPGALNIFISIDTAQHKGPTSYQLRITANESEYSRGLLPHTLSLPESKLRRLRKKEAVRKCQHLQTRWSVLLKKKEGKKFNLRSRQNRRQRMKREKTFNLRSRQNKRHRKKKSRLFE